MGATTEDTRHGQGQLKQYTSVTFFQQALKYGLVGISNTVIGLGIIYLLMFLGVHYLVANVVGYAVGLTNSFFLNKYWTFGSRGGFKREAVLFLSAALVCFFLQLVTLWMLVEQVGIHPRWSQLFAMIVYTSSNFLLNRTFTFREVPNHPE